MKWINSIFSKQSKDQLRLKFSKKNESWIVTRNQDIVFMGGESQCRNYMDNFKDSEK